MSIYKQLNNKKWLYDKYFVKGLSTLKIAKLVGAKQSTSVRQALLKFGWTPRNHREGQIFGREDVVKDDTEIINGTLLGDASLNIFNRMSLLCQPHYVKKSKHKSYGLLVGNLLVDGKPNLKPETYTLEATNHDKVYKTWVFRTPSSVKLREYFDKWYPKSNGFRKVVPKDLVLTPRTILYWFMDDGYSHSRNRANEYKALGKNWKQRTNQIHIGFCTESFTKKENDFLCKQLKNFGLNAVVIPIKRGTGWRIHINQSSAKDFFDLIGPCPVKSMQYKWKIDKIKK